jgi:protein TonB
LSLATPAYPELARQLKRSAHVVVRALVDENGRVLRTELAVADKSNLGFNEAAVEVTKKARFRPGTKDGVPVKVWVEIPVGFTPR